MIELNSSVIIINPKILYQGANQLLRSDNGGHSWTEISPDLTRNDSSKHSETGIPFTNETAGGEVYNTISYIASSPNQEKVIWVGSDDGLGPRHRRRVRTARGG